MRAKHKIRDSKSGIQTIFIFIRDRFISTDLKSRIWVQDKTIDEENQTRQSYQIQKQNIVDIISRFASIQETIQPTKHKFEI